MLDWVQVRALAGPHKDIHRVVLKPLLCCLGCVLWVIVLLEDEPSAQSEVLSTLDQVFIKDISVLCSVQLSLNPDQSPQSLLLKNSPQHDAATTMLHCWDGAGQVMSGAWFPPDMTLRIEAKQFSLGFIRPENLVSHSLRVL